MVEGNGASPFFGAEIAIRARRVSRPRGKLAEVDLLFGPASCLSGLLLVGFGVWRHRDRPGCFVTFPSNRRHRRNIALLRVGTEGADAALRAAILATTDALGDRERCECYWGKHPGSPQLYRIPVH